MDFLYLFLTTFIMIFIPAQNKPAVIPFSLENNSIYIHCKVNNSDQLKFLFDTGADGSVINTGSKKDINLKIDGTSANKGSNGINMVEYSSHNIIQYSSVISVKMMSC
ncbi:aspartyl protease family protein [Chryseobacterium arthrosphaerae]|uniref:aspartyl protease family protein n=2 Tax=Chryseobacterium arthrosphaerae TaxID=651561 RepID=UPI0039C85B18|nr:aspartyl protease family protein [Chryseobacterium arthrosphaerae]